MKRILILGGIREAVELAEKLDAAGHDVTTSLAGRTKEPKPPAGKVRVGGFGGSAGLANWLRKNNTDLLIDCTHPFAKQISANAEKASKLAQLELQVIKRRPWEAVSGDRWQLVSTLEEACDAIPAGARALLALGSQHISHFKERTDVYFVVRMVDKPEMPLPFEKHELVLGKPSQDPGIERQLLEEKRITHIVCRNSGGRGAYAKIEAARKLGLPIIMIEHAAQTIGTA